MTLRSQLPRRTVRLRLAALYSGLFALSGAALLTITYVLVDHATDAVLFVNGKISKSPKVTLPRGAGPPLQLPFDPHQLHHLAAEQHSATLHELVVQSAIALAVMVLVSIALGWLLAGRVLDPLRTITTTTQRISERNLHERLALAGPRDELTDLADTIDALLGRLETAFDAQRRFVANASHELRTPLAMMRTSLDVAAGKPRRPPELTELEVKLREGLDQADRLLESFLMLARAEHGELAEQTSVRLDGLLRGALAARTDELRDREQALDRALAAATVVGNETLLARMVANLLDNAIRHSPPGATIVVSSERRDGRARLTVRGGGPQLDPVAVRELAQPFQRLGGARTGSQDGVGLGLAIVSAIAAAHGGVLALHAADSGGLAVVVELPDGGER